ncbi:MAG: hypothetical protein Q9219_005968 [cf. Caloplaca sp. 3 TL-2023]
MAEYPPEKQQTPAPRLDYEGLELDTRAGDGVEKHLDHTKPLPDLKKWQEDEENSRYLNEKQMIQAHEIPQSSPTSPESSTGILSPQGTQHKGFAESLEPPPAPRARRICGLRRGIFWLLFGIVLAVIIVAAVVGGVVGGTRHSSNPSDGPGSGGKVPASSNIPAQPGDVIGGSPLNVISYVGNGTSNPESKQIFRVYYQPIFTDALNNTGLATVVYMNGTAPTGQMFYVGVNGFIQEKRKSFNSPDYWEPGPLNPNNIKAVGNLSLPDRNPNKDPINKFDSYRMAAAYSENFCTGAGTRLFHHAAASNGSWVQEWIWVKETDDWRKGQAITNVYPSSHLAATVDEQNSLLRLYFSSGNLTLQEVWLNISDPNGLYNNGFSLSKFLPQNDADLTATSYNGTTYIYHPSNIGELGLRELTVSGVPGSTGLLSNAPQESYNVSEPLVARPSLVSMEGTSPYQPVAAGVTRVNGLAGGVKVYVFWADKVTGEKPAMDGSVTGYGSLQEVSRDLEGSAWWGDGNQLSIPLGSSNSFPEPKSSRRRWLGWI